MNHANLQNNSVLATALRILSEQAAPESLASTEWSNALVSALIPFLPPAPAASADLIAPHDGVPGLRWHADQLLSLCQARTEESPANRARRAYHARMLGYGLAPARNEFRPLVTVLLPVYNRAGPLVEAVQSCIDQTWRPIEILVVDDGSTDDVRSALRHFGDQVRLIRKDNGGVASARNLGLREARGDFIQFLDSDDLLLPRAIDSKLAAFDAVADAELCYGQSQRIDMRTSPSAIKEARLHVVENPARSMIVAFPFLLQTVMMPRWRLLVASPFEEDLRRSSDFRYWQCLSLAGIKVIGSRELSTHLRRFSDSLHLTPEQQDDSHAVALMRGLRDLARHPQAWRYGAEYLNIVGAKRAQCWFGVSPSDRVRAAAAEAIAALEQAALGDPSPLPMFAAMRANALRLKTCGEWPDEGAGSIYRLLAEAIGRCFAAARPLNNDDVSFWSLQPEQPENDLSLVRFFVAIETHCAPRQRAPLANALLRAMPRIPSRRIVRQVARLSRIVGPHPSSAIVTRWMQLRGR
jgi:glycosyltransferase involved in cell wall biosynthesis